MKSSSILKGLVRSAIDIARLFAQAAISVSYVFFFSRFKRVKRIEVAGRAAVVLGNGPSLSGDIGRVESLSREEESDVWAVNNFAITPEYRKIKPRFYVLADPNYWNDSPSPQVIASRERLFDSINSFTDWPLFLYVPFEVENSSVKGLIKNEKVRVVYYNRTPVSGLSVIRNMIFDSGLGMPPAYNVLIAATYLAIRHGYRKISIFGADHSWHEDLKVNSENELFVAQNHFYDKNATPDKIYKGYDSPFGMSEIFSRWGLVFLQYEVLRDYAVKKGVLIYNCSSKSYIDAFDRPPSDKRQV